MTLEHLQSFKAQIEAQLTAHRAASSPTDLGHANQTTELIIGLNFVNQLILMEEQQLAAPPGMLGPGI